MILNLLIYVRNRFLFYNDDIFRLYEYYRVCIEYRIQFVALYSERREIIINKLISLKSKLLLLLIFGLYLLCFEKNTTFIN